MLLVFKSFLLAFSALLPVINPLGSALLFLGVVGTQPQPVLSRLARKIAISTVLFLLIIELAGAALLAFFEISLPVVQLAGGFVLAAMGWQMLNAKDTHPEPDASAVVPKHRESLDDKVFYPLTFPLTAGPGCIVVTLTLSAHLSQHRPLANALAHLGIMLAIVGLGISVFLCYVSAPRITKTISPQTVNGILRVISFVVLCIGVQIAANGLGAMIRAISK
jgi:multiple antibiotic resistance protein